MSDLPQPISTERALKLLTKPQRRQILRQVAETPDGTPVDQLKTQVEPAASTRLHGGGSGELEGIELHHLHLPKLQDAGVIEYDASQGTVYQGQQFQEVLSLLEVIEDHRENTSTSTPDSRVS